MKSPKYTKRLFTLGILCALVLIAGLCFVIFDRPEPPSAPPALSQASPPSAPTPATAPVASAPSGPIKAGPPTPDASPNSSSAPDPFTSQKVNADGLPGPAWIAEANPPEPYADTPAPNAEPGGERATAALTAGSRTFHLPPDQGGSFPRVYVRQREKIAVEMQYPDASPGEPVVFQVIDGGRTETGSLAQAVKLDAERKAKVNVQVSGEFGVQRVTVRKGGDLKHLDFWVGHPLPLRDPTAYPADPLASGAPAPGSVAGLAGSGAPMR